MKKTYLLIAALCSVFFSEAQTYEYQVITSVESIIPSGAGRSRLISTNEARNYQDFTSERTDGKKAKDKRNKSDRSEIRVKNFEETKLLNFFNIFCNKIIGWLYFSSFKILPPFYIFFVSRIINNYTNYHKKNNKYYRFSFCFTYIF